MIRPVAFARQWTRNPTRRARLRCSVSRLRGRTLSGAHRQHRRAGRAISRGLQRLHRAAQCDGGLGKRDAARNFAVRQINALESHIRKVPEDARARILLATTYAHTGRREDAVKEAQVAMSLRPNEATVLYNVACVFTGLEEIDEALDALKKAHAAGFHDTNWARRDPDLEPLLGHPEFERLFPAEDAT